MSDESSFFYTMSTAWRDNLVALTVGMFSGLATYAHKRLSRRREFIVTEMVADLLLAGLAGLVMFWLCAENGSSDWLTGVAVGVAGHSAPRLLAVLDRLLIKFLGDGDGRE